MSDTRENLVSETREHIRESADNRPVAWIGSAEGDYAMTLERFCERFAALEYDAGWGISEIAGNLVIVYDDGSHSTRGEYDGSEWWEYHPVMPVAPQQWRDFTDVVGRLR